MRKIPTVFLRDPADRRRVLPDVTPGCEWVIEGEGVATRKYDGTCVMLEGQGVLWWARREVKPGKQRPPNFHEVELDENTGKTVGWEPIEQSPFARYHAQALARYAPGELPPDTYELIGPRINGNPEHVDTHMLVRHLSAWQMDNTIRDFEGLRVYLLSCQGVEGIVWHHIDGRYAKLKRKDFTDGEI